MVLTNVALPVKQVNIIYIICTPQKKEISMSTDQANFFYCITFVSFRHRLIALHSVLSTQDQGAAFTLPPLGVRKV